MAINVTVFALQFLTKDKLLLWGAKVGILLIDSACVLWVPGHGRISMVPGPMPAHLKASWLVSGGACTIVSYVHEEPLHFRTAPGLSQAATAPRPMLSQQGFVDKGH